MKHHDKYINLDDMLTLLREQKEMLFTPEDVYELLRQERFLHGFNLVKCEDCKYYSTDDWFEAKLQNKVCECYKNVIKLPNPDDYCSLGEFRDDSDGRQ